MDLYYTLPHGFAASEQVGGQVALFVSCFPAEPMEAPVTLTPNRHLPCEFRNSCRNPAFLGFITYSWGLNAEVIRSQERARRSRVGDPRSSSSRENLSLGQAWPPAWRCSPSYSSSHCSYRHKQASADPPGATCSGGGAQAQGLTPPPHLAHCLPAPHFRRGAAVTEAIHHHPRLRVGR